jgi:hypothetical protein
MLITNRSSHVTAMAASYRATSGIYPAAYVTLNCRYTCFTSALSRRVIIPGTLSVLSVLVRPLALCESESWSCLGGDGPGFRSLYSPITWLMNMDGDVRKHAAARTCGIYLGLGVRAGHWLASW